MCTKPLTWLLSHGLVFINGILFNTVQALQAFILQNCVFKFENPTFVFIIFSLLVYVLFVLTDWLYAF